MTNRNLARQMIDRPAAENILRQLRRQMRLQYLRTSGSDDPGAIDAPDSFLRQFDEDLDETDRSYLRGQSILGENILLGENGFTFLNEMDGLFWTTSDGLYWAVRSFTYGLITDSLYRLTSGTDVAVNGGFETGDFTGWTEQDTGGVLSVTSVDPHGNDDESLYCALWTADGSASDGYIELSGLSSSKYLVTFWAKYEGSTSKSGVFVTGGERAYVVVGGSWKKYYLPVDTTTSIKIYAAEMTGEVRVDDVQIYALTSWEKLQLSSTGVTIPGSLVVGELTATSLQAEGLVPTGTILMQAGSLPPGFLECDGSAVSRTTYENLFASIGTTYGSGDGSTTFNVPDLRGRAPVGAGTGAGLTARSMGASGGAETHQLTASEMPSHLHSTSGQNNATAFGSSARYTRGNAEGTDSNIFTGSAGSDTAHNNMQPFAVVRFVIKY